MTLDLSPRHCHFTRFGINLAPKEADREGYLHYRTQFQKLPENKWTDAEKWIDGQEKRIYKWRKEQ